MTHIAISIATYPMGIKPAVKYVGREINALFDIIDLPTALFGFAAFIFN